MSNQIGLDQTKQRRECVSICSEIYDNTILCSLNRKKGQIHHTPRLRSDGKFYEPSLRQMVAAPHQTTPRTQTSLKRQWNRKQKWKTKILHRPKRPNRAKHHHTTILFVRPWRTQSNPRIPMVRSDLAQNRLEERMDRPLPTSHSTQSPERTKSNLRPKDTKCPTTNP